MQNIFTAYWYDPAKVEVRARKHGWNGIDELLDCYSPEEDPSGHEAKSFRTLDDAVNHLKAIIAKGDDFFGQGEVHEIEVPRARCSACTCGGRRCVRVFYVDHEGVADSHYQNDCLYDE